MTAGNDVKVLIIGAGLSGLMCALECKRAGLNLVVLESRNEQAGGEQKSEAELGRLPPLT